MIENPFKVGDTVVIKKPSKPYPKDWPNSHYSPPFGIPPPPFGIPLTKWDLASGKNQVVIEVIDYMGHPSIKLEADPVYCWPASCANLVINLQSTPGKIFCNCPDIFIKGCQNKKDHN